MKRASAAICLTALFFIIAFAEVATAQSEFEVADIHTSPVRTNQNFRTMLRGGRYEIQNANMVDLIRTAYGIDADKVLGGPSWLEYDRFDIIAKADPKTPQDALKTMLQALLADRFKLVVRKDTRPLAGYALSLGKSKHKLKEADPSGKTGCQSQPLTARPSPVPGQPSIPLTNLVCRNISMEAFAESLRTSGGGYIANKVVDSTGLKGAWDFDLQFTSKTLLQLIAGPDGVTLFDAVDKQLGLKLEEQKLPTPVMVVDSVNKKPSDNPPDLNAKLPALPPAEFEVADIKPVDPNATGFPGALGFMPGGRVSLPRFPLKLAIMLAWNLPTNPNDSIAGAPKWLDTAISFDIIAKAPAALAPASGAAPLDELGPMLQNLLIDRFKMKVHFEDQQVTAYTLVAAKPKLKKADPSNRTGCKVENPLAGMAVLPGSNSSAPTPNRQINCQNITMAQFAEQLQFIGGTYLRYPVVDATGLEGAWDFTLSFSPISASQLAGLRGALPAGATGAAAVTASDPIGGTSLFDAVEKQLGLKLDAQKRAYPVFVIDHIEEKPTEN